MKFNTKQKMATGLWDPILSLSAAGAVKAMSICAAGVGSGCEESTNPVITAKENKMYTGLG